MAPCFQATQMNVACRKYQRELARQPFELSKMYIEFKVDVQTVYIEDDLLLRLERILMLQRFHLNCILIYTVYIELQEEHFRPFVRIPLY